jgi:hypothetical protein
MTVALISEYHRKTNSACGKVTATDCKMDVAVQASRAVPGETATSLFELEKMQCPC